MPAWQALITRGIDTHRALPVDVVVGQRMGDGGNGAEIDDVSDSVESWSLAIACVETVLNSQDKPTHENGKEKAKRYRWESDDNSSPRSEARGFAEVVLDTTNATDARSRDTRALSDDDAGHSLPLVMACVEAVLGSGDEGNDDNGEWSVATACAEAVLDTTDAADARPPYLKGWRRR